VEQGYIWEVRNEKLVFIIGWKVIAKRAMRHYTIGNLLQLLPREKINRNGESASSPLVGFGELNDNTIIGLTSLLSVE
jgi:hypothetical protein